MEHPVQPPFPWRLNSHPLTRGLVLYSPIYERQGTTIHNLGRAPVDGIWNTEHIQPTWKGTPVGDALHYIEGADRKRTEYAHHALFEGDYFTGAFFARYADQPTAYDRYLFMRVTSTPTPKEVNLRVGPTNITFKWTSAMTPIYCTKAEFGFDWQEKWVVFVVSADPSGGRVYEHQTGEVADSLSDAYDGDFSATLRFGGYTSGAWEGQIAGWALWNRVLSSTEVREIQNDFWLPIRHALLVKATSGAISGTAAGTSTATLVGAGKGVLIGTAAGTSTATGIAGTSTTVATIAAQSTSGDEPLGVHFDAESSVLARGDRHTAKYVVTHEDAQTVTDPRDSENTVAV
jgi:hypothetical protein